jgi:hypothetical protein
MLVAATQKRFLIQNSSASSILMLEATSNWIKMMKLVEADAII